MNGFVVAKVAYENLSKEDLFEVFETFVNMHPSSDILNYPFILKSLKYFREEFIDSDDENLMSYAKLAHKLYLYWRSIAYTEYLTEAKEKYLDANPSEGEEESETPDLVLKAKVYKTITKLLQKNKFDKEESLRIASKYEQNMRKVDPTMTEKYQEKFAAVVEEIKSQVKSGSIH